MAHTRKSVFTAVVLLAATAVGGAPARAQGQAPDYATEIGEAYTHFDRARRAGDVKAVAALLAADYTLKTPKGAVLDRDSALKEFAKLAAEADGADAVDRKIVSIDEDDDTVVAVTVTHTKATFTGTNGSQHAVVRTSTQRDRWVHAEHGWQMAGSEVLESATTMDGRPIDED